jgi:hypothetical protein
VDVDGLITVGPSRELVRGVSGHHKNLPGMSSQLLRSDRECRPTRRIMKVSAYGCWCSLGPTPDFVVDSKIIEMLASPGSSS